MKRFAMRAAAARGCPAVSLTGSSITRSNERWSLAKPVMLLMAVAACGGATTAPPRPAAVVEPASDTRPYGYEFAPDSVDRAKKEPPRPASLPMGPGGRLFPEAIQGVVRSRLEDVQRCYDRGQKTNTKLAGMVTIKSSFGRDGVPTEVADEGSTLLDKDVVDCVVGVFRKLRYPTSRGGKVTFVYPVQFGSWE